MKIKVKDFTGIRENSQLPNPEDIIVPEGIGDLLDDYVESTCSLIDELEAAAMEYESKTNMDENSAKIKRILHKIKGESGMVGFDDINEFCHQAEFAFDELASDHRPDMILRFRDWVSNAIIKMQK
jgi:chemotaxis protein histidine kinase CheA